MVYRNKTYIAFDGDTDIQYYYMLKAWKENEDINFNFYDAHSLNTARDSSLTDSIKNQLMERFNNSKIFVILVGQKTKLNRKYIPWEIKQALKRKLPIIVVNLNNKRERDDACPSLLKNELTIHIPFKAKILNYAIQYWPDEDAKHRKQEEYGAYHYSDSLYKELGL